VSFVSSLPVARFPTPDPIMPALRTYLVEDSPVIRENLVAALEELVDIAIVGTADSEAIATSWLHHAPTGWDLVVIDIFLKSGSGLGVLASCRDREPGQRLVVLSNYATADMRRKCTELGADAVFDKSNEIDALVAYCQLLSDPQSGMGVLAS
jgi:two-component system OmpR family response regulator